MQTTIIVSRKTTELWMNTSFCFLGEVGVRESEFCHTFFLKKEEIAPTMGRRKWKKVDFAIHFFFKKKEKKVYTLF